MPQANIVYRAGNHATTGHGTEKRPVLAPVIAIYAMLVSGAAAEQMPTPQQIQHINANWVCQWCPTIEENDSGSSGEINIGVGYVSNDSFKQGNYTGLDEKGAYLIGGLHHRQQYSNGDFTQIEADKLGLNAKQAAANASWGSASIGLSYDELPSLSLDTARSPYHGTDRQTLSTSFVKDTTTQGMTQLGSELKNIPIDSSRKTLSFTTRLQHDAQTRYSLDLRQISKEGRSTAGLALGSPFSQSRAAILAIPVSHTTQQAELAAEYVQADWQSSVRYQLSEFTNDINSLQWENAFTEPSGVNSGQASLTPDNSMQQLSFSGAYLISEQSTARAMVALGQQHQNDNYLPYSNNSAFAGLNLPQRSLDGKINTFNMSAFLQTRLTKNVNITVGAEQHELDNDTDRATYDYVIADTSAGNSRANLPYSFRQRKLSVKGEYQNQPGNKLDFGYHQQQVDRTYQAVEATTEDSLWAKYRSALNRPLNWSVNIQTDTRDGDDYGLDAGYGPLSNPQLRKYNLADRNRERIGLTLTYNPANTWQLSLITDYAKDDYSNSPLGLQDSDNTDYTVDFSYMATTTSINIAYSQSKIASSQLGGSPANPWRANNDEQYYALLLGLDYSLIPHRLNMGLEYHYARSEGDYTVDADNFPQLSTERHTVALYGDYRLSKRSKLHLYYQYEDYQEDNWAIDQVNPNTIDHVLSLGEISPDYAIGFFAISLGYEF